MKSTSDRILPAESERDLRRLRFTDPRLERAFQQVYAEKARMHLRWVLGITLPIPTLGFITDALAGRLQSSLPSVCVLAIHLGALLLTWSPWFARLFQAMMALLCLSVGTTLMAAMLPRPEAVHVLLVASLYTYTLYRLRFLNAVVVYWSLIGFFLVYSVGVLRVPLPAVSPALPGIVIANLMGMLAAYTLEHWSRRDFFLTRELELEREKSERLLLNMLPEKVAARLKEQPGTVADEFAEVTVLFADIVDFTPLSDRLTPDGTVKLLNEVFSCFDALAEKHGLEKIKTIGDAYMVVGGLPEPREDHADAVLAMALDMQREITRFRPEGGGALGLRIGINTGPVVAGVIGTRKFIYDLWGDTVNTASRMETYGVSGGIQITAAAYERLRRRHCFTERRLANVKGKGEMTTYLLTAVEPA